MLSNMYKNFLSITKDSISSLGTQLEGPIDEESEYGKADEDIEDKQTEMRFKSSSEASNTKAGIMPLHHDQIESLMTDESRNQISKDFVTQLTSPKLQQNLRTQYKTYKNPDIQKGIKDIGFFNSHEAEIASNDPLIVGQAKRINHAILDFVDKETKGIRQKGIVDIFGSALQKNPVDYIHKEALMAKEIFGKVSKIELGAKEYENGGP